jgi:hypothetical protein
LIVAVTAVVLLFKIQNFEAVTVSFFGAGITMPTSLLIIVVYALGMVSASALLGLLRVVPAVLPVPVPLGAGRHPLAGGFARRFPLLDGGGKSWSPVSGTSAVGGLGFVIAFLSRGKMLP